VPQSRNTRLRPKNTSRAEARRRHRDEQRETEIEPNTLSDEAAVAQASPSGRPSLAMPDIRGDLAALPQVFRNPLVWLPFGLLLLAFGLEVAIQNGALPEGQVTEFSALYVGLVLPPMSLFVFFIGGFVASRASYLVGGLLGIFDATLITILVVLYGQNIEATGVATTETEQSTLDALVPIWGIALVVGVVAAGFAAWYRRFLRSSQERAKANRAIREQEQAHKAKEQARADKEASRKSRRTLSD
jgi:hypothetical protein